MFLREQYQLILLLFFCLIIGSYVINFYEFLDIERGVYNENRI